MVHTVFIESKSQTLCRKIKFKNRNILSGMPQYLWEILVQQVEYVYFVVQALLQIIISDLHVTDFSVHLEVNLGWPMVLLCSICRQ